MYHMYTPTDTIQNISSSAASSQSKQTMHILRCVLICVYKYTYMCTYMGTSMYTYMYIHICIHICILIFISLQTTGHSATNSVYVCIRAYSSEYVCKYEPARNAAPLSELPASLTRANAPSICDMRPATCVLQMNMSTMCIR